MVGTTPPLPSFAFCCGLRYSSDTMHRLILGSPSRLDHADGERHILSTDCGNTQPDYDKDTSPERHRDPSPMRRAISTPTLEEVARSFNSERGALVSDIVRKPLSQQASLNQLEVSGFVPAAGEEGEANNPWKEIYLSQFSGLQSYGDSGMTRLEEMIEAALKSCDVARKTCPSMSAYFGASLLTQDGRIYTGCSLESASNPLLNVTAERTVILKAISDGKSDRHLTRVLNTQHCPPCHNGR